MVDVILLNWNHEETTLNTARKLGVMVRVPFRLIVVDNGSEYESVSRLWTGLHALGYRAVRMLHNAVGNALPEDSARVVLIENGRNLGFAGGVNQGLALSLRQGLSKYALLLNCDVDFADDFIAALVEAADADDRIGAVGGLVLWRSPRVDCRDQYVWYGGGAISWISSAGYRVVAGRYATLSRLVETPRRVGFITGAMMLLRLSALREVGLLDERFFFGGEDSDLCIRLKQAGYHLYYTPKARIWHESTKDRYDPDHLLRIEYIYASRSLLWRKHKGPFLSRLLTIWLWAYALTAFPFRVWVHARRSGVRLRPRDICHAAIRSLRRFSSASATITVPAMRRSGSACGTRHSANAQ